MNRRTTLTCSALTMAGLIAVAGCGRSETGTGSTATGSAVSSGKATGKLTVWAMGVEGEKLPALVKEFEAANPGTQVTVTPIPWDSAHGKFTAAIAANQTPDLAMVGTTWMGEFVGLGALDPTPSSIDKAKFFEGAQKTTEVGGTSYAVPWNVETRLLYYRTDLAKKAGINEAPKDWDGLKAMAKAYQEKAGAKWGLNIQPGETGSWQAVLPFAWGNGAKIASDDGKQFTFDTPEMVEAVKYYQSFFTEGLANKAPVPGQTEADFTSGRIPAFVSGPWMMSLVEKMGGAGFKDKYAVAQMPYKKEPASFVGGANLAVFKNSKNRDSAWKLIEWLTDPAVQVKWYKATTDLPSVQKSWEDPALSADKMLAEFGTQLKTAKAPPAVATWEQVAKKFDDQIEKVCKTGADAAAAVKQIQADATSIGTGS